MLSLKAAVLLCVCVQVGPKEGRKPIKISSASKGDLQLHLALGDSCGLALSLGSLQYPPVLPLSVCSDVSSMAKRNSTIHICSSSGTTHGHDIPS